MSWEIRRLDECEPVLKEIERIARPVGILLFGADGYLKDDVCNKILSTISHIGAIYRFGTDEALEPVKDALKRRDNVLVVMDNLYSRKRLHRHATVEELRSLGARVIVGVCVRYNPGSLENEASIETDIQLQFKDAPTIDGLNYLIIVHEPQDPS